MWAQLRRWMPLLKVLFTLVVLAGVVWFFARVLTNEDLQNTDRSRTPAQILWDQAVAARPAELGLAAALYLCGMAFSGLYWVGLLRAAGAALPVGAGLRAYYVSHLGKYTPGMGLPTVIRMTMAAGAGVRPGTAALTAVYETLATMAAGALVAAVLIAVKATNNVSYVWWALGLLVLAGAPVAAVLIGVQATNNLSYVWWALGLLVLAGVPILPGVFNPLVRRMSARFTAGQPLPRLPALALPIGLAVTACGWALLGASLYAVVRAVQAAPGPWNVGECLDCVAVAALSYVAGFVGQTPGGVGVRELILQQFLAVQLHDEARALVVALLVRVLWTTAELAAAGALFWLPVKKVRNEEWGVRRETKPAAVQESGP
jgi:uncharacterized membrane protein YbhN (UPF0104 family)